MNPTSKIAVVRDISYTGSHSHLQSFDLYIPSESTNSSPLANTCNGSQNPNPSSPPPLICFVHGGAWRSEDKSEHAVLAQRLAALTSFPVAVPNYRLTKPETPIKHPAHAEDVLHFLHFLLDWEGPKESGRPCYDSERFYLVGHSCSAHMLASIFLSPIPPTAFPTLEPSGRLLEATLGIIFSEGIYDIDLLLESFPEYKAWFIADVFGEHDSYAPSNTAAYNLRPEARHVYWLIMHSLGDTLVDIKQSRKFHEHITGMVEDSDVKVMWDDSLEGDHDEVLTKEQYAAIVARFVLDHPSSRVLGM
ncbi:hypothetical protein QCA50_003191 [Cerrena zonata]|uniref:BD-FAE-like domain-containing protein n=1 Tax=Cerrena zonata TaxID=2478898 RepID=A0AAW0GLW6_9APHY